MGDQIVNKVPITGGEKDFKESESRVNAKGSVISDDCPFIQVVKDDQGKVRGVECADDSGVKPCEPGSEDCRLQQWMESVKAFIRQIDVAAL